MDLRQRAVAAVDRGEHSQAEVAEIFGVSKSSLEKWLRQARTTGSVALRTDRCGRTRVLAAVRDVIQAEVSAQPDATLDELCERLQAKTKVVASQSMMCRELNRLGLRRKKMLRASEQDSDRVQAERAEFREYMAAWLADKLKFLDESGAKLVMTRLYGRAEGHQRVYDHVPKNYGSSWTITALISLSGVEAPMILEGAMDTQAFETYIETQGCPTLHPDDIVIMSLIPLPVSRSGTGIAGDNLSAHTSCRVRELIEARGAHLHYLPAYSPDFNPIELCWSKVKTVLRSAKAKTVDALLVAIRDGLLSVTPTDIRAWFSHAGYAVT